MVHRRPNHHLYRLTLSMHMYRTVVKQPMSTMSDSLERYSKMEQDYPNYKLLQMALIHVSSQMVVWVVRYGLAWTRNIPRSCLTICHYGCTVLKVWKAPLYCFNLQAKLHKSGKRNSLNSHISYPKTVFTAAKAFCTKTPFFALWGSPKHYI